MSFIRFDNKEPNHFNIDDHLEAEAASNFFEDQKDYFENNFGPNPFRQSENPFKNTPWEAVFPTIESNSPSISSSEISSHHSPVASHFEVSSQTFFKKHNQKNWEEYLTVKKIFEIIIENKNNKYLSLKKLHEKIKIDCANCKNTFIGFDAFRDRLNIMYSMLNFSKMQTPIRFKAKESNGLRLINILKDYSNWRSVRIDIFIKTNFRIDHTTLFHTLSNQNEMRAQQKGLKVRRLNKQS